MSFPDDLHAKVDEAAAQKALKIQELERHYALAFQALEAQAARKERRITMKGMEKIGPFYAVRITPTSYIIETFYGYMDSVDGSSYEKPLDTYTYQFLNSTDPDKKQALREYKKQIRALRKASYKSQAEFLEVLGTLQADFHAQRSDRTFERYPGMN